MADVVVAYARKLTTMKVEMIVVVRNYYDADRYDDCVNDRIRYVAMDVSVPMLVSYLAVAMMRGWKKMRQ
jgi:hypothetical protein